MTERNNCILDNKASVKRLYTLEKFPVFMGCVDTPVEDDIFFDQDWGVSENGLVQLKTLIDPNIYMKTLILLVVLERYGNSITKDFLILLLKTLIILIDILK